MDEWLIIIGFGSLGALVVGFWPLALVCGLAMLALGTLAGQHDRAMDAGDWGSATFWLVAIVAAGLLALIGVGVIALPYAVK